MQVRRPFYATLLLAVLGTSLAWLYATPLALAIPIGVGGLLLTRQYQFLRDLHTLRTTLTITQTLTNHQLRAHHSTTLTIDTTTETTPPLRVELTPRLPHALATTPPEPLELTATTQSRSYTVASEIAGHYEIPAPELTCTSRDGRFSATMPLGDSVELVVTPAGPREIHVGEGGDRFAAAYGEHPAGNGGAGLDPSELRQYLPGDPTNRIDWKATARLNEPHVREFEAETDRETHIILDTRPPMATGPPGETKLDYARQLALAFVDSAANLADPLGLTTVDDTDSTTYAPAATPTHYRRLRTRLHDLTTPPDPPDPHERDQRGPDTAYRDATRLNGDDSRFAAQLRPFLTTRETYVQRLADRPLFTTTRRQLSQTAGRVWTILVTDDSHPVETREAVKLARRNGGHVLVCLLPTVLYEPGALTDLDTAYQRYQAFEEFRRGLAGVEGVRALEVGPRDRLAAILTTTRSHQETPA